MLAAEPAEPGIMNRPPRRPGKRLLGKLVMWRCVFVCAILVVLVLGMFYWAESEGKSLENCRSVERSECCWIAEWALTVWSCFC